MASSLRLSTLSAAPSASAMLSDSCASWEPSRSKLMPQHLNDFFMTSSDILDQARETQLMTSCLDACLRLPCGVLMSASLHFLHSFRISLLKGAFHETSAGWQIGVQPPQNEKKKKKMFTVLKFYLFYLFMVFCMPSTLSVIL